MSEYFMGLDGLTFATRILIILIISGFMPLSAISFFYFMVPKKEQEFGKAVRDMGIQTSRKVRDTYAPSRYVLPVIFVFLICFLAMLYIMFADQFLERLDDSLFLSGSDFGLGDKALMRDSLEVFTWAFLGAFTWSAYYNVIRRLLAYDLAPSVYYSTGIRILLACFIALVFSFILRNDTVNIGSGMPALAFLTGWFPERILNYIIDLYKRFVDGDRILDKQLSLDRIEGISMQHKERLQEIGIDNAQNLATHSLTQLLIKTPFEPRELLDWMGQAKLLLYAKDSMDDLRSVGIRTVFDFYQGHKTIDILKDIAEMQGINPNLMEMIFTQVRDDTGVQALTSFLETMNSPGHEPPPIIPSEYAIKKAIE